MTGIDERADRWRRYWNRKSRSYDREMGFWDRRLFRDSRAWVCGQASGAVLEVAIGTGLNLPHYPPEIQLTGIDVSAEMLAIARRRAAEMNRWVDLREGDAHQLDFADASFDTAVCTFGLCAIPDPAKAVSEMVRVMRPGGRLLLADHIAARSRAARGVQCVLEVVTVPWQGEHFRRRPLSLLKNAGLQIQRQERFGPAGIVERVTAVKPREFAG